MRPSRLVVTATIAVLVGVVALPADAAAKVDQRCAAKQPRRGYYGGSLSQSFTPSAKTVGGVDVHLVSTFDLPADYDLRIRLVGRRVVYRDQGGAVSAQVVVVAESVVHIRLYPFSPTWVPARLPKAVAWDAAGAAVDQYAVEVTMPSHDHLLWLQCAGYSKGEAWAGTDPGSAAQRDTGSSLNAPIGTDLGFVLYSTSR